jgi:hypothetical protein
MSLPKWWNNRVTFSIEMYGVLGMLHKLFKHVEDEVSGGPLEREEVVYQLSPNEHLVGGER